MEVLALVTQGKTMAEIADQLSINHKTIHVYRNRIFQKLSVNNDVALTRLALREGLITLDGNKN
jgi:two-component system, NarL family, invasion response regulator UvrY